MAISNNVVTNSRFRTVNLRCDTDDAVETLYTCPANCRAHMSMLHLVNAGGSVTVDVEFNRSAATQAALGVDASVHILGGKNMSTGDFIQFLGAVMVLEPGDTVSVTADGTTPTVDVIATVEEFFLIPG